MSNYWGTFPQWISAAASFTGVGIALYASRAWLNTLMAKRGDDLLTTAFDFVGAIGAMNSAIERKDTKTAYGSTVARVYASFLELEKAHVVARRSYNLVDTPLLELRLLIDRTNEAGMRAYEFSAEPSEGITEADFKPKFRELMLSADSLRKNITALLL